jgi:hypothetical protein
MTTPQPIEIDHEHINVMLWAGLWLKVAHNNMPLMWPVTDTSGDVVAVHTLEPDTADQVGRMLVAANTCTLAGPVIGPRYCYTVPRHTQWQIVEILRAVHFYSDQQLAHAPGWLHTEAAHFCQALQYRLTVQMPGYLSSPGHLTPTVVPARAGN